MSVAGSGRELSLAPKACCGCGQLCQLTAVVDVIGRLCLGCMLKREGMFEPKAPKVRKLGDW